MAFYVFDFYELHGGDCFLQSVQNDKSQQQLYVKHVQTKEMAHMTAFNLQDLQT